MDKKRIMQYQSKYLKERKENISRNENPKSVINDLMKMKKDNKIKPKTQKKIIPKNNEQKEINSKNIDVNYNPEKYQNKLINNTKHNDNIFHKQKNTLHTIKERNKKENNNNNNENITAKNKERNLPKYQNFTNKDLKIQKVKNEEIIIQNNTNPNPNNTYSQIDENKKTSLLKMRNGSVGRINISYSKFINNIKKQMENFEETERHKYKNKNNLFSNFLTKFINKNERNDYTFNTTKNSFSYTRKYERYSKKITNLKKNLKSSRMNLCFIPSTDKSISINNDEDKKKIKDLEKELELKENKINELLQIIERKNFEYTQLNYNYNYIITENEKLKEKNNNLKKNNKTVTNINLNNNISNDEERQKYNNLITYNINKNNNYNIINSEINNINNIIQNDNNNKEPIEPIIQNNIEILNVKEKEKNNKDEEQEKKANRAFERFKKANKKYILNNENKIQKSEKISNIAKSLENYIGNPEKNNSLDNYKIEDNKSENMNNSNDDIVDLIDNKPVIHKKKKRNLSFDG